MVFVLSSYDTTSAGANGAAIIGVYSSLEEARKKIEKLGRLGNTTSDSGLGDIEGDNGTAETGEGEIHYHVKDVQQGGRRRRKTRRHR
jgi:hypothetical protein